MAEKYIPKKISRNPNDIIQLPYISNNMRMYVPKGMLGILTSGDKKKIRQILNLRFAQGFPRCRGKVKKFILAREAEGDFSHSDRKHICDECRCGRIAGSGTKGNFYGLGVQTGHYGVGFCEQCIRSWDYSPGMLVKYARIMVRQMQTYGTAEDHMDSEVGLKIAKQEAGLVRQKEKVREDMDLLKDTLKDFKSKIGSDSFTEMTTEGPMPAADKTKAELALKFALAISKINLADLKMSRDDFVNVDEITKRVPAMMTLGQQCMSKIEELVVARQVKGEEIETDRPIQEYVGDIFMEGMSKLWRTSDMKLGQK